MNSPMPPRVNAQVSAHPPHDAHQEAQHSLPWLANGTLEGTERERIQAHLHGCAACRSDLALLHTLRAAGQAPERASEPGFDPALHLHLDVNMQPPLDAERALARLLPQLDAPGELPQDGAQQVGQRIAQDIAQDIVKDSAQDVMQRAAPAAQPVALLAAPPPVGRRWRDWLAANDRSWLRAAVAMQCCAIAVLAALLARPAAAPADTYRLLGAGAGVQASLVVTFRPDTPERELRRIVQASGARIVGGPTATGAWLLATEGTSASASAAALARLRAEAPVTLAESLGEAPVSGRQP